MLLYTRLIPGAIIFAIVICAVVLLVVAVSKQERKMDRYNQPGIAASRELTRKSTWQGICFIVAFLLAWGPWYIYVVIKSNDNEVPRALRLFQLVSKPMQGVYDAAVYFRPRYLSDREKYHAESRMSSVYRVLKFSPHMMKCCRSRESDDELEQVEVQNNVDEFNDDT